jgi:cytochrome c peroxidase
VARANAEIDKEETSAMNELEKSPPSDFYQETTLLGKLELFDKNLSVKKNLACTSCHLPSAGFIGAVSH